MGYPPFLFHKISCTELDGIALEMDKTPMRISKKIFKKSRKTIGWTEPYIPHASRPVRMKKGFIRQIWLPSKIRKHRDLPWFTTRMEKRLSIIISFTALVVSLGSAIVTTHNLYRANRPYVTTVPYFDPSMHKIGIYLSNAGTGAAILLNVSLTIHGKTYSGLGPSVWPKLEAEIGISPDCFRTAWPRPNDALKVGNEVPLIALSPSAMPDCLNTIKTLLSDNLRIHVDYQSVFEKPYSYDGSGHLYGLDLNRDSEMAKHN